jgi:FkbM family methyltransferase
MKKIIKKIFNLFGLHLSKINAYMVPAYQTVQALKAHNIDVVFDVGANEGQFASELRAYGYKGKIVSFEPLPDAYKELVNKAKGDENWIVHSRCALGAVAGEIEINVAANSVSSSILPMLSAHEDAAPQSKYSHKSVAKMITLDSVLNEYSALQDNLFIKIDTQGYEWKVLDGAERTLSQSKGLLLELSLIPLYEGQKLWLEIVDRLSKSHHSVFAIQPGFTDNKTGQTLQADGLFFVNNEYKSNKVR